MPRRTLQHRFAILISWIGRENTQTGKRYLFHAREKSQNLIRLGDQEHNYALNSPSGWSFLADSTNTRLNDYPLVSLPRLRQNTSPPKGIKMLSRDFIDDSLYNPSYGYFSKEAVIFSPTQAFAFKNMHNSATFHEELRRQYGEFEERLAESKKDHGRQIWHTPTELFQPYYGEAIARYILTNYKMTMFPYHDLIIFEIGGGNGTLVRNIMNFIKDNDSDIYERTRYKIVEISASLANSQSFFHERHAGKIEIINKSIFDWDVNVPDPCFVLALEVFDNFPHDVIRYDPLSGTPFQGIVVVDEIGNYHEFFTPYIDQVALEYLKLRDLVCILPKRHPLERSMLTRRVLQVLQFAPNLTIPEFIPTGLFRFFGVLRDYFPNHRILASDFSYLPDSIQGVNAPVVQTRYKTEMVACSTYMVRL